MESEINYEFINGNKMIVMNEIKKFDISTIFRGLFFLYIGLYPPYLLSNKNQPLDSEPKNWEKLFENSMFEKNTLNNWIE